MSEKKIGFTIVCNSCGYKGSLPPREDELTKESFSLIGGHSGEGSIFCGKCGESYSY